jgi:Fe-S cluster assembly protein SufB
VATDSKNLDEIVGRKYQHGFVTDIESDTVPPGLDEDVIRGA